MLVFATAAVAALAAAVSASQNSLAPSYPVFPTYHCIACVVDFDNGDGDLGLWGCDRVGLTGPKGRSDRWSAIEDAGRVRCLTSPLGSSKFVVRDSATPRENGRALRKEAIKPLHCARWWALSLWEGHWRGGREGSTTGASVLTHRRPTRQGRIDTRRWIGGRDRDRWTAMMRTGLQLVPGR